MCRNEAYLNPYMKLMISSCGHKFCESCVSRTFQNETEFSCTVCKMTLRKNNLISQNREDQALEKEARLRQRILEQYNKRRENFENLTLYNDYLEEVEDIIMNLLNQVNVKETTAKIEKYKQTNRDLIAQNQSKKAEEDRETKEKIEELDKLYDQRKQSYFQEDQQLKQERIKDREERIQALADGRQMKTTTNLKRPSRSTSTNSTTSTTLATSTITPTTTLTTTPMTVAPTPVPQRIHTFTYQPQPYQPLPTPVLTPMPSHSNLTAPQTREAGGYNQALVDKRALEEALSSLWL